MLESREESKSTRSDDVTSESRSPGGKLPILEAALADLRREVQTCHQVEKNGLSTGRCWWNQAFTISNISIPRIKLGMMMIQFDYIYIY